MYNTMCQLMHLCQWSEAAEFEFHVTAPCVHSNWAGPRHVSMTFPWLLLATQRVSIAFAEVTEERVNRKAGYRIMGWIWVYFDLPHLNCIVQCAILLVSPQTLPSKQAMAPAIMSLATKRGVASWLSAILEVKLYWEVRSGPNNLSVIANWEVVRSSEVTMY